MINDKLTKDGFKELRDKYANDIVPLYANHPYRFLVEEDSDLQDLTDSEIDSMDLTSGEGESQMLYSLLKGLCSTELPRILAQFPNEEAAEEAYTMASLFAAVTGSSTATELTAELFLTHFDDSFEYVVDKLEELFDSVDIVPVDTYIDTLKQYLSKP